ncbi:MAG: spore cortex biosynthesis protein YabQ [Oscillospiraceae bacterium]|nr:spore cortex biosynthesis protein YabQ [Oscillospiraceae bacterium]
MGNDILTQLFDIGKAVLLGCLCALVYDFLRVVRLRGRKERRVLTAALDVLFCAFTALFVFAFAMTVGGGGFGPDMAAGSIAGFALYARLLARLFRPLWEFWVDAAAQFFSWLRLPVLLGRRVYIKIFIFYKKDFLFRKKSFIMNNHRRLIASARRSALSEQGANDGKDAEKAKSKKACPPGSSAARASHFDRREPCAHPNAAAVGTRRPRRNGAARRTAAQHQRDAHGGS